MWLEIPALHVESLVRSYLWKRSISRRFQIAAHSLLIPQNIVRLSLARVGLGLHCTRILEIQSKKFKIHGSIFIRMGEITANSLEEIMLFFTKIRPNNSVGLTAIYYGPAEGWKSCKQIGLVLPWDISIRWTIQDLIVIWDPIAGSIRCSWSFWQTTPTACLWLTWQVGTGSAAVSFCVICRVFPLALNDHLVLLTTTASATMLQVLSSDIEAMMSSLLLGFDTVPVTSDKASATVRTTAQENILIDSKTSLCIQPQNQSLSVGYLYATFHVIPNTPKAIVFYECVETKIRAMSFVQLCASAANRCIIKRMQLYFSQLICECRGFAKFLIG